MKEQCTIEKIIDVLSELDGIITVEKPVEDKRTSQKDTVGDKNKQLIKKPVDKGPSSSLFGRVRGRVEKVFKGKKETLNQASDSGGSKRGRRSGKEQENANLEIQKLQNDIRQMKSAFEKLTDFQSKINKSLEAEVPSKKLKAILSKMESVKSSARDLTEIRRKVLNLKGQIPSLLKKQSSIGFTDSQTTEKTDQIIETGSDISLPGLHVSDDFKESPAFEEVKEKFEVLEFTKQLCLLSLAVFPENKEVQRTMLMYWWIGEGFISDKDPETEVTEILDEFSREKLLEPVEDERKLKRSGYKMAPHVHSAVIRLASHLDLYVLHDKEGKLVMTRSGLGNVCLVKGSSLQQEAKKVHLVRSSSFQQEPKTSGTKQIELRSVFNSSERYPDFTFKWFPKTVSLKVLYLGRWERTAKRHIEVESTEFLKDIKLLRNLRLASFQGISRIENLRDLSCKLPKLVILDLRACYNLEALPDDIGSLVSLIYLDVSECYMLDRMPIEIADLKNLQVLKGFVISQSDDENSCTVEHLQNLQNLKKLSITVNREDFKVEDFMESMKGLRLLESLKIAWGAPFPINKETTDEEKQGSDATKEKHTDPKEGEDDQVHKKGQTSQEKSEDGTEKATLEEGKKRDEVKAESDKVVEGEKKTSPSRESTEKKKPDGGDKGKADQEEGKKRDEVKAESMESEKKASPSGGETGTIQKKPDDEEGKSKVAGDGDKGKAATEEGKKQDTVDAEKSENGAEGVTKASPSSESTNTIENKQKGDKQEEKGDGEKEKANLEEGKKKDKVEAVSSKPDKVIEGDEKTSPPQESKDTAKSKPDDHQRGDKQEEKRDGEEDKTEEGKKKDEVKEDNSKPEKVLEGDKKTSRPQESQDTVESKPDDHQIGDKKEEKRDGEKDKTEEGKKKDEVKEENSISDKVLEGDKKTSPPQESQDTVKSKPDDHQRGDKQVEERDGENDKTDEGKKKDEVKPESSKLDKVIEGDKKKSLAQQFNDTIQSKPDDHKENSKVQEKEDGEKIKAALKKPDGGEAKNQKLDKKQLGKNVGFSEEAVQKKSDDAMEKENHEMASTSRTMKTATKESGFRFTRKLTQWRNEAKKLGKGGQEDSGIDTSKLPSSLKKLELECYPKKEPPIWLNPKKLDKLEKLSIKGGSLSRFRDESSTAENKCTVQVLRLKYLHEFKAEWKDLRELFPKLELLEKYKCPEVAFCPTNGNGVWRIQP